MKELRKKERTIIQDKPVGNLKLIVEDESTDVQLIGNLSPFGIMIQVKKSVEVNTDVGLFYTIESMNFEILGTVKWTKTHKDETADKKSSYYQLGISFWPQNTKENMDFFNILSIS